MDFLVLGVFLLVFFVVVVNVGDVLRLEGRIVEDLNTNLFDFLQNHGGNM